MSTAVCSGMGAGLGVLPPGLELLQVVLRVGNSKGSGAGLPLKEAPVVPLLLGHAHNTPGGATLHLNL